MKANELMIGDIITFKDSLQTDETPIPVKVVALGYQHRGEENGALVQIGNDDTCDIVTIDEEFVGYPLTAEILEKNGFQTKDNAHFYSAGKIIELLLEEHPFIGYSIHWVKTIETINPIGQQCFIDYYIANLEYVHELQHALRLCGIEKEIEL